MEAIAQGVGVDAVARHQKPSFIIGASSVGTVIEWSDREHGGRLQHSAPGEGDR